MAAERHVSDGLDNIWVLGWVVAELEKQSWGKRQTWGGVLPGMVSSGLPVAAVGVEMLRVDGLFTQGPRQIQKLSKPIDCWKLHCSPVWCLLGGRWGSKVWGHRKLGR